MTTSAKTSTVINVITWAAQLLLVTTLLWAGATKLFQSPEALTRMWPWTGDNRNLVLLTGILDLLAGVGLILPSLIRVKPRLTIYAASGTALLMVAASIFHIARGEAQQIGINVFLFLIAVFIVWARGKKVPIL